MGKQLMEPVQIPLHVNVPLGRRGSDYPRDVLDGLNLSIKEAAGELDADYFKKVFYNIS